MMAGNYSIRPGQIVFFPELSKSTQLYHSRSVRVIGTLEEYDVNTNLAVLENKGIRVILDTTLLGVFDHRLKSLFMVIGELGQPTSPLAPHLPNLLNIIPDLILQARVIRCVDGLDQELYERSVQLMRKFEKERVGVGF
ncbi:telomere-capping, CST complex subunit-domain-containing protein [Paraphysoderma sedebokerense]|nr:telomere-capping, CST complex subunit-domain-containing protein [Paraphysoderma sedebokerense]